MNAAPSAASSPALPVSQPPVRVARLLATWLLSALLFLVLGFLLYAWCAFSPLLLIGRSPAPEPQDSLGPADFSATMFRCCGPVGWIVGLGVLALAFAMALTVYRWPWPLRLVLVAAPPALVLYPLAWADVFPWIKLVLQSATSVELLLAVLAAVFCRPAARRLLPWLLPQRFRTTFFAGLSSS